MQSVVSLDTPIAEDNSLTLVDTLQDDLSVENDTVEKYTLNTLKMNCGAFNRKADRSRGTL
ncbi:hypothetical protein D7V86_24965 [bacterium D16-51]|nr:hypothetical protein D7V96_25380 [bacterium D16-59]RKI53511.1 hypothetical protein D7V86_24965 [bacterium D16-51]